ncbi:hypothetical protein C2G38_2145813 [Gigaspora rosea]|uniref:Kinase-like domain-containing protein n=1 Tax=Gigaspora rosea TaxID=44941 RepID=A0A397UUR8_9GLOM|nr:hypothetical protein C2G38_2145813 [Gigaspora rosea]
MHPEMNEYAMVMKRAIHGDLRKFIDNSKLSWPERIKIISNIAKSLNKLHDSDVIYRDLHCGNILVDVVDNDTKIFISDFGFSRTIDSPSKCIIGVLPYVAPEVLCGEPYIKESDIYSLGTIMWELTSFERPFSDRAHDIHLAHEIVSENLRPKVVEGIPKVYKNIMERCWDANPSKRPDLSLLINEYEELIKDPSPLQKPLRKDSEQVNSSISEYTKHSNYLQSNYVTSRSIPLTTLKGSKPVNFSLSDILMADTNEDDTTYGGWYEFEFPKGDDFYIKTTSPSGHSSASSTRNYVVGVDHGFFVSWGAVKEGSKVIIAQQKSTTEHDGYQLWHYDDGFLINKQTTLYLETESVKAGSHLVLHHRRSGSQAANQKWTLTKEGHIKLKDKPYVLEAKDKHVVLADASKASKHPLATQFIIHPVKKSGAAIGVVRLELVCAKSLKDVDSFLAGKSDPYVRVFHSGNNKDIIAQTKVIYNDLNPVWNEVHYLPVRYIGEKFILDVMDFNAFIKDKPLGNCILDITGELVKEVSEGCYEGTPNGIDVWAKLTIQGQIHYKAKFFPLEPLPKPTPDFFANLKEKPFGRAAFYVLITLQAPNGGFPPSDTLANLFGFESQEQLLELYKKQCREDRILKINQTVWTTNMILWLLRFLLKDYRSEWDGIYERAEQFISKEINDLEIEEIVVATGRKVVRDRFDIVPDHKKLWEAKEKKAREFLSKEIGDAETEKELFDCTDRYVVDNATKKVEKDHKKNKANHRSRSSFS